MRAPEAAAFEMALLSAEAGRMLGAEAETAKGKGKPIPSEGQNLQQAKPASAGMCRLSANDAPAKAW